MTRRRVDTLGLLVLGLSAAVAPSGCGEKPQQAQAPQEEYTPPPEPERRVDPMDGVRLSPKVTLAEAATPATPEQALAVAGLANAIAEGDATALRALLDEPSQGVLDELKSSGAWESSTKSIEAVRVCSLESADESSVRVGIGVQDEEGAYLLGWEAREVGGRWLFAGLALEEDVTASDVKELDATALAMRDVPSPRAAATEAAPDPASDPRRDEEGQSRNRRRGSRGGGRGG